MKSADWKYDRAREMRSNPTWGEKKLWSLINKNQMNCQFYRQVVKFGYILDFYCPSKKVCIEVDGPFHNKTEDAQRDANLARHGIKTLRFKTEEIWNDSQSVQYQIYKYLNL